MIYYVEDDKNIRDLVVYALKQTGFSVTGCADGAAFRQDLAAGEVPSLILLDVMLPDEDGVSILKFLKQGETTMQVPVIMLTARGAEYDKVLGLDTGADDYITKPFSIMELVARVKAVLRRSGNPGAEKIIRNGNITLNDESHTVTAEGKPVLLTFKEYELLRFFLMHPGCAFDRDTLLNEVWSIDYFGGSRTVDVHVQTLRQKLGEAGSRIETIRGLGYRIGGGGT